MDNTSIVDAVRSLPGVVDLRLKLAICLIGGSSLVAGCTQSQVKSLVEAVSESEPSAAEIVNAPVAPAANPVTPASPTTLPAESNELASAIDVNPGSGRDVILTGGFKITPPETFNVIEEREGSNFHEQYQEYRWERTSGGAWFIVTFLSGLGLEGAREPEIHDERFIQKRLETAFARADENHQLRSNGSQNEQLAGLSAVRTNVTGKVQGKEAVGHLYVLFDGKQLIEIVALATEANRKVLMACRKSANSLSRAAR